MKKVSLRIILITVGDDFGILFGGGEAIFTVGSAINSKQNITKIFINKDAIVEEDEAFTVTLAARGPGNPQINPLFSVATITIIDNDCKYIIQQVNKKFANKKGLGI